MRTAIDGPAAQNFCPLSIRGNLDLASLSRAKLGPEITANAAHAPAGRCVAWGIPFHIRKPVLARDQAVTVKLPPTKAPWLILMHACQPKPLQKNEHGLTSPARGEGHLGDVVADYVFIYADGAERSVSIRRRFQIGPITRRWGENCFEAVAHRKPHTLQAHPSDMVRTEAWGRNQTLATPDDNGPWVNWLWAWQNPRPGQPIVALRIEPCGDGAVLLAAISAGNASSHPLRWETRRKAILTLPAGQKLDPRVSDNGQYTQIQLDMGQVISATPRPIYPDRTWAKSHNNQLPEISHREVIVEYAAHPDATFHLSGGKTLPVAKARKAADGVVRVIPPADQRVSLRIVEKGTGKPVAVKLHIHGQAGEYLAPTDRNRVINGSWFEDYSVDFTHCGLHHCCYIDGTTSLNLPVGKVFIEVSKGFEIRPVRQALRITRATSQIVIEIEKVLPWREKGWVTADTHVHFLSPTSALLEGAAEGVNVVNLLASQWGELMTNVGDFDGKTTWGARDGGGNGEYLVRVGTENRQHVLGHISLLGYNGPIIAPMTTGGPDESAIGDPVEVLLTEWTRQCKQQEGVVILPHFPNPRAENAASVVAGQIDGVEMTSWGDHYSGINPYSLSDWYRYLNCGYMLAAVGGTDKMAASTAVGTVRTYARIDPDRPFDYDAWKDAVRRAHTFVTYGPLLEMSVEGNPPGTRMKMSATGGTVTVDWQVASVTVPMTQVQLVVNGVVRESRSVQRDQDAGSWTVKVDASSWLALLVRGHQKGKPEIIAAHSSPVMVEVEGSQFLAAADALTILEQIEGAMAYLDTLGTRAQTAAYKRMKLELTAAHRQLHNRMHQQGSFHQHTPVKDHAEHHEG